MNQEEYEDRMYKMQRLHKELEQTYLDVNKIIPYSDNDYEVYSPRFVFILQDASRQVDGMFKLISNRLQSLSPSSLPSDSKKKSRFDFIDYYNFLNSHGMLVAQKLAPKDDALNTITPFRLKQENVPKWWQAYNDTKHDLPEGETFGKLGHVLYAVGAIAILHDIAEVLLNRTLTATIVLDGSKWLDYETAFKQEYVRTKNKSYRDSTVDYVGERSYLPHKSSIFYYLTQFHR